MIRWDKNIGAWELILKLSNESSVVSNLVDKA